MAVESTRSMVTIANRRRKVAEMYLRGIYQTDIAEELGVNQATISRDLAALRKEWLQSALVDLNEAKARELAKVDQLEMTYWAAWERSREDAETHVERHTPQGSMIEHRKVGQSGNPAFLEGIMKCISKRCDILGIEAPKRMDVTSDGKQIGNNDERFDRALSTLADAIREVLPGAGAGAPGAVGPAEQAAVAGPAEPGR